MRAWSDRVFAEAREPENHKTALYSLLNICSSVSVVMVNKAIFQTHGFTFGTLLTFIHFIFTFLGCVICLKLGMFERARLRLRVVVIVSALFCGFVVFTNLSLTHNTVGFYQVAKIMTAPTIVALNLWVFNVEVSRAIIVSLVPILLGVGIAMVTDVQLNWTGSLYASLGVVVTSFYQIWVKRSHEQLSCNSMQLLLYQAPTASVFILFLIPVFDDMHALIEFPVTLPLVLLIVLSAVLAFFVNFSIFVLISHTSPLTYNVIGHFKSCMIIALGFLFFSRPTLKNVFGVCLALGGIFYYTHLRMNERAATTERGGAVQLLVTEEDEEGGGIDKGAAVNPSDSEQEGGFLANSESESDDDDNSEGRGQFS